MTTTEDMLAELANLPRAQYTNLAAVVLPIDEYDSAARRASIYLDNTDPGWRVKLSAAVSKAIWQDDAEDTIGIHWATMEAAQANAATAIAGMAARPALTQTEYDLLIHPWQVAFTPTA